MKGSCSALGPSSNTFATSCWSGIMLSRQAGEPVLVDQGESVGIEPPRRS